MKATIIESFCEGKFRDDRNEDRIFLGDSYVAVIDGSSAALPIGGRAGGIVAAEAVKDVLSSLPAHATIEEFASAASNALAALGARYATPSPYAAAVVLVPARHEIWRIGDCPFAIDGLWNIPEHNPHERAFFAFRQMMTSGYAGMCRKGAGPDDGVLADTTRDWLAMTKMWVNASDDPFAFAALDESPTPRRFLEVFDLGPGPRVVTLASDGAVVSPRGQCGPKDVAEMLDQIAALRVDDPSCVSLFPYWRGFLEGSIFLDDTSLLRARIDV